MFGLEKRCSRKSSPKYQYAEKTLIGCFFFSRNLEPNFGKSHRHGYLLIHSCSTMDNSMALDYPISKFEADNNLADPNVELKYRTAADIANGTLYCLHRGRTAS